MKRTFYFLKDSVTGKFYDGKNSDGIVDFDKAAVYFQRKNAEKRMKQLISGSWEWTEKCLTNYDELHWDNKAQRRRDVKARKNLPNWGIEVVEVVVEIQK
jgi:hypothetical protein